MYHSLGIRESPSRTLATSLKVAEEADAEFAVIGKFEVTETEPISDAGIILAITVTHMGKWRQLGEIRIQGKLSDLGMLETRAAYLILSAIRGEQSEPEVAFLARFPPVRLDARENYIRGLLADSDEMRHRYFTQAARLDDKYPAPAFQLGAIHWQKRDCRQAVEWLRKVADDFPRGGEAKFMRGVCDARLGRYADAEEEFRSLYAVAPLAEVANNLAVTLGRQQKEGDLPLLTYAVERDPDEPDYHFNLGHALWMRERYDDAADRFREVLDLQGEDAEATRMLGRCLQREASRPARAAVGSLGRLKEDFDDSGFAIRERASVPAPPAPPSEPKVKSIPPEGVSP